MNAKGLGFHVKLQCGMRLGRRTISNDQALLALGENGLHHFFDLRAASHHQDDHVRDLGKFTSRFGLMGAQ